MIFKRGDSDFNACSIRRGASTVDALVCKLRGFAEIVRDSRHIKPGSSIYDDKVTRGSRRFRLLPLKNSADQLRVRLWTASAKSIEALRFQSEIVGRNRERLYAA